MFLVMTGATASENPSIYPFTNFCDARSNYRDNVRKESDKSWYFYEIAKVAVPDKPPPFDYSYYDPTLKMVLVDCHVV
jgi:hypothetical protein